jgi:hypothetical protein
MSVMRRLLVAKPIPHIPLPFREVIADLLKVKPPEKAPTKKRSKRGAR